MSAAIRAQGRTPRETVLEAVHHLADETDAADNVAWERAWHRLRVAFNRYRAANQRRTVAD